MNRTGREQETCPQAFTAIYRIFQRSRRVTVSFLTGRAELSSRVTDLAITTGIHGSQDVLKGLMAGAKVTMMASELLRNGLRRIKEILAEIETWMDEHEYVSVAQMIGSMSQQHCTEPAAFERANYMKTLDSFTPIN